MSISLKRKKDISKRKTPFFCVSKGLSNKQKNILCRIHFKDKKVCLCRPGNIHVTEEGMCKHSDTCSSDGQSTDPQSMEHPNGQPHANGLTL